MERWLNGSRPTRLLSTNNTNKKKGREIFTKVGGARVYKYKSIQWRSPMRFKFDRSVI